MQKNLPTLAATVLAFAAGLVVFVSPARAEHRSFCFTGARCGCHGEVHMIDALDHIDRAFRADSEATRVRETVHAKQDVMQARDEVCDHTARRLLDDACDHLIHFLGTRRVFELDSASDALVQAIGIEQRIHARPLPPPAIVGGPVSHGHSYSFSGTPCGVHGEDHLIEALQHLDSAYHAFRDRDRIEESVFAKQDVMQAYHEMCDRGARDQLLAAVRSIARFQGTGRQLDIDEASRLILSAIRIEQVVHANPVAVHGHHHDSRPVPGGPVYGSRPAQPNLQFNIGGFRFSLGGGRPGLGF